MTKDIDTSPEAVDPRCAKCGHKRSEHHYRHTFVGPSREDTIATLSARVAELEAALRDQHKDTKRTARILLRAEATDAKLAKAMLALVDGVELAHGVSFSDSKIMSAWGQRVEIKINSTLAAITDKDAT